MRRSQLQIIHEMLVRIRQGPVIKSHLFSDLRLTDTKANPLLEMLIDQNFIQVEKPFKSRNRVGVKSIRRPYYTLLPRGREWIADYEDVINRVEVPI